MVISGICFSIAANKNVVSAQEANQKTSQEADQEVKPSTATSAATTEKLKERIEKIVEEKRDQIKGVLSAIDQQQRGTIGNVTRVSEESVTIKTRKTTEIIALNEDVQIEKDGDEIAVDEIAVDDWLVVLGLIEDDTFSPKRVLVSSDSLRPATPVVALGSIDSIERSEISILPRSDENTFSIATSTTTQYQDLNGDEIDRTDLNEEMQALVVGSEDEDGEKTAHIIRVLAVINDDEV